MTDRKGALIIIGGHEDKEGDRLILRQVAERLDGGRLVIATIASHQPDGYFESYRTAFADLGATDLVELYVDDRNEALDEACGAVIDEAAGVFFSGGDQLRLASLVGDTPLERRLCALHDRGGVIAGTSAGASMMSETMLVAGPGSESYRLGDLRMAPGLGLIAGVIIDQHFAERGRIGRLLGAVAHNPRLLGLGIDEDSAIVVEDGIATVIGTGAITVVDAHDMTFSNVAEDHADAVLTVHGIRLHVLGAGQRFDLAQRTPGPAAS